MQTTYISGITRAQAVSEHWYFHWHIRHGGLYLPIRINSESASRFVLFENHWGNGNNAGWAKSMAARSRILQPFQSDREKEERIARLHICRMEVSVSFTHDKFPRDSNITSPQCPQGALPSSLLFTLTFHAMGFIDCPVRVREQSFLMRVSLRIDHFHWHVCK